MVCWASDNAVRLRCLMDKTSSSTSSKHPQKLLKKFHVLRLAEIIKSILPEKEMLVSGRAPVNVNPGDVFGCSSWTQSFTDMSLQTQGMTWARNLVG